MCVCDMHGGYELEYTAGTFALGPRLYPGWIWGAQFREQGLQTKEGIVRAETGPKGMVPTDW